MKLISYHFLLTLLSCVHALDVTLRDVICDQARPIYAEDHDISMECNGETRCKFGKEVTLTGRLHYNNTEEIGLEDGYAFLSSDLSFLSLDYTLFNFLQVPICGNYITPEDDDQDECPADGVYNFKIPYVLPSKENQASWVATGWNGKGKIIIYAEANNLDSVIGQCQLYFSTAVSSSTDGSVFSKFPVPSAMITSTVILAFVSFIVLAFMYRTIRDMALKRRHIRKQKKKGRVADEDTTCKDAPFTMMED